MKKYLIILAVLALAGAFVATRESSFGGGGFTERTCNPTSTEVATLGHQESTTVLSAFSGRAWARLQQPANATNTISFSFDDGGAAVVDQGVQLTEATTTSPISSIVFGRNTDFPYTGAVTAISDVGSTTVLVTECRY